MSSPTKRTTRSSQAGTPRRSTRTSAAPQSSPAPGPVDDDAEGSQAARTPRAPRASQLQSSPLFYQSSPAAPKSRDATRSRDVSSPLRQMTDSQSTAAPLLPSSPLRQQSDTQSIFGDGDRTPRASGLLRGKIVAHPPAIASSTDPSFQTPHLSHTRPAPAPVVPFVSLTPTPAAMPAASSSHSAPALPALAAATSTRIL